MKDYVIEKIAKDCELDYEKTREVVVRYLIQSYHEGMQSENLNIFDHLASVADICECNEKCFPCEEVGYKYIIPKIP